MRRTAITYADGGTVSLGDVIDIATSGNAISRGRIVMLGDTGEHLEIDQDFVDWVIRDKVLGPSEIVVEWLDDNPLEHNDPNYAPVGNYMFTQIDSCVVRIDV